MPARSSDKPQKPTRVPKARPEKAKPRKRAAKPSSAEQPAAETPVIETPLPEQAPPEASAPQSVPASRSPVPWAATQLTLRFRHRVAMRAEDFLVSDSNADAVAWIDRWPDWPAPALVVFGPPGCGKTHLVNVWRARSGAPSLPPEALQAGGLEPDAGGIADPTALLHEGHPHCAIERPAEGLDEHTLLHLYNILREQRGTMLLTAEEPPSRWGIRLLDLRSRLLAAPAVGLGLPDDGLIAAVIAKLFADRQIHVRQDVIDYYLRHRERSFAAARDFVARLDEASLSRGRRITATLARQLFSESPGARRKSRS